MERQRGVRNTEFGKWKRKMVSDLGTGERMLLGQSDIKVRRALALYSQPGIPDGPLNLPGVIPEHRVSSKL